MANVEINSLADAKDAAKAYGVEWPEGRGKPPVVRLRAAIEAKGDAITGSYVKPRASVLKPAGAGKREYDVTVTQVTERKPDSKGYRRKIKKDHDIRVNVAELRDVLNLHQRGTLGRSNIISALVKLRAAKDARLELFTEAEITAAVVKPVAVTEDAKPKAVETSAKAASKPKVAPVAAKPLADATEPIAEPVCA